MTTGEIIDLAVEKGLDTGKYHHDMLVINMIRDWLRIEHEIQIELVYDGILYDVWVKDFKTREFSHFVSTFGDVTPYRLLEHDEAIKFGIQKALKMIEL